MSRFGSKGIHRVGNLGMKALALANRVPFLREKLAPINDAIGTAKKAVAVVKGAKQLGGRGMSLLRGDVSQAAEILRDGKALIHQSQAVVQEAKDTIQKVKRKPANEQGMKFV